MADLENSDILAKWLNGSLSKEEEEELLLSHNLEDLSIVVKDIDTWKLPERNTTERLEELKNRIAQKKNKTKVIPIRIWISIAASILVIFGSYLVYQNFFTSQLIHLETAFNESMNYELPDGSLVELDGATSVEYNESDWDKERKIELKGQALFTVKKGASFIVETVSGKVEVLGTKFDVRSEEQLLEVSCYEGLVKVSSQNETIELSALKGVSFVRGVMTKFEVKTEQPDWKMGFTEFEDAPLYEVISSLNSRYNTNIILPSNYKNLHFTGRFINDDFENALKMVFDPIEISYTLDENNEVHF